MNYTVWYKTKFFWNKIKNVKGDGIIEGGPNRFFILDDETRIEIPGFALFKFCPKRFFSIKQSVDEDAGQVIPLKKS